jgi:hypothetical protein
MWFLLLLLIVVAIGMIFGKGKETLQTIGSFFYICLIIILNTIWMAIPIVIAVYILMWLFS